MLLRLSLALIIIYIGFSAFVYVSVGKAMFPVPPPTYEDTKDLIKLKRKNGEFVVGKFTHAQGTPKGTIIYSHGNGEDIGYLDPVAEGFAKFGYNVLVYDYPGYGLSEGEPTEANMYEAIDLFFHYLHNELKIKEEAIILYGFSLGSGPTLYLAQKHKNIQAIILQSPMLSAYKMVDYFNIFPGDRFPNYKRIKNIATKTLFIHGEEDLIIPISHAKRLYELSGSQYKEHYWIERGNHNSLVRIAGDEYWRKVILFLDKDQVGAL
jgi:hypothetical protein